MQNAVLAHSIRRALMAMACSTLAFTLAPTNAHASKPDTANATSQGNTLTAAPKTSKAQDQQTKKKASDKKGTSADNQPITNLGGISVTGQLAALRRAQAVKRDAIGIVDSVSAEEAGKFPDQNVADALQRVPGVSVNRSGGESNQITVRGFGPNFVNVLLNGRTMATAAPDRAFDFDIMPSAIISTAVVHKTANATLEEGGIGGTVNIVTARPFDFKGFHANASVAGVYDTVGGNGTSNAKTTPKVTAMIGNTNADDTFGWLASVMYYKRDHTEQSVNTSGWIPNLDYSNINPAYTNISLPQTLQGQVMLETRTRRSFNGAIDWKPIDNLTVKLDSFFSNYKVDSKYSAFGLFMNTSDVQALTADSHGTALSYTRGNTGILSNDYIVESNPRNAYNEQHGLNVAYQFDNSTTLTLDSSFSKAWNKQSPNGYFFVLGTRNVGVNPTWVNNGSNLLPSYSNIISTTNTSDLRAHYFGYGTQSPNVSDRIMENRLHLTKTFVSGVLAKLDFGVQHSERAKTLLTYQTPNAVGCSEYCGYVAKVPASAAGAHIFHAGSLVNGVSPGFPQQWVTYDVNKLANYLASPAAYDQLPNPGAYAKKLAANGGGFAAQPNLGTYGRIVEIVNSAYGEATFEGDAWNDPWTLNVGLRYSKTQTTSHAYSEPVIAITVNPLDTSNAIPTYGPLQPIAARGSYSKWLPSADFKINLRDNLIFRLAASKTMTRPKLSDLTAAKAYNFRPQNQTVTSGNAKLQPYVSTNFDTSLEWYINRDSYISLDGFYKKVTNFTTLITEPTTILGFPFQLTKPVNLNTATIKGAEFTFNYQFHQLPAPFDGLGTAMNYTYVTSNASLNNGVGAAGGKFAVPGIGDSANFSAYYQKGPVQVRLAYNWRAKYLTSIAGAQSQPTTVKAYGQLDFSGSYKIHGNLSVFLTATNLTNENIFRYQVYPNRPSYAEMDGRTFTLGLRDSW